ncbi:hypothetical protein GALMADRAFT_242474 [Galerina marginata CBS 339.88]|uniref:N-acetylglucosaminylphosphatidylinositol deacetylase n=1 Tax=Galerina marginata (strain CBS 339.88) TaxID=685588 RepID=A0A067TJU1_GALM3|nr:hypothetical protein GALMADRAFT_242474 [Galerina marginata CBS 339.88]
MVSSSAIFVLAVALVLGSLYTPLDSNALFATQKPLQHAVTSNNILLVTAHPDDEALFFAPTILALQSMPSVALSVVCLSTGNAEGLGHVRKLELDRSLRVLGVDKMRILDHPELQDNQTASWDAAVIASVLKRYVADFKIDTILTFDSSGISSHPNHQSLPAGATALIQSLHPNPGQTSGAQLLRLFTLQTTSLPLKYTSLLAVPLTKLDVYAFRLMQRFERLILSIVATWYPNLLDLTIPRNPEANAQPTFVSGYEAYGTAIEAMRAHESQWVWFRYLYVAFSRYMWVNSYVEVRLPVEA